MPRRISIDTVRAAATRIYPLVVRTPLIELDPTGPGAPKIFLKLDLFQAIGSFKIRGAMNAIAQIPETGLRDGVWTVSAGNAAQGVALAARQAGTTASVLVMDTAPATKLAAIERLGATIVKATYDECWTAVESHQSDRMRGRLVHPFDDDDFISGNGTIALEILEDLPDADAIVAPMGGGGLLAGIGAVLGAIAPQTKLYAAEPDTAAPLAASLAADRPVRFDAWTPSFVDGAGGKSVLPSMWPLVSSTVADSIVVSLPSVAEAMRLAADRRRIIAEGAAGCAIAAALSPRIKAAGHKKVVAVVSGGNIDLARFATVIGACG